MITTTVRKSQLKFWLVVYLMIEAAVLFTLVRQQGVFYHAGLDFLPSYAGAQMLVDGGRMDLYDTFLQWHRQQPIIDQYGTVWPDRMLQPYVAPPILALLAVPLLVLSPLLAWITWSTLNIGAVLLAVVALVRRLKINWTMVAFFILGSFPLFYTVLLGQVEGILLLAMVIFVLELRRGNEVRAALALSVLALKPQLLLAPLVFLAATGHRRAFITTGVAGAVQLAISTMLVGIAGMREYVEFGRRLSQPEGIAATNVPGMVNLRAMIVRAVPYEENAFINIAIVVASLALLGLMAYLWRELGTNSLSGPSMALLMTTTLLTSYHALYHTAIFATLAAVFMVEHAYREQDVAGVDRMVGVAWVFLSFGPLLPFLIVQSSRIPAMITVVGILFIWALALRAVLVALPTTWLARIVNRPGAEAGS